MQSSNSHPGVPCHATAGSPVTRRDEPSTPAWSEDRLDSSSPPEIEAAYFDDALAAWVLSRHSDVLAAFRSPSLTPTGPNRKHDSPSPNEGSRLQIREEVLEALNPVQLCVWRERLAAEARVLVDRLPVGQPVDVIGEYARPVCMLLAAMVTGIDRREAERLEKSAQQVSAATAEPYDPILRSGAKPADAELKSCFHSGPQALRDSGFVAISQTLPCILGNAWFALLKHPRQWRLLHQKPQLMGQAIEELLRYAGLVRIVFRMATEDVDLNGSRIRKGDSVILRIMAANRDTERFLRANEVDITRREVGHLTLGSGPHSCVGASLIRMALITITDPLVKQFNQADLAQPIEWRGGSVFRSPSALWVRLSGRPHDRLRTSRSTWSSV